MRSEKYDNAILVGRSAAPGRSARGVLRCIWRAFLDGAARYGAAMHGWPNPDYFRSDVTPQEDKE